MHVYTYSIVSICYTSDTKSLDETVSYLNVCDQKKKKLKGHTNLSQGTLYLVSLRLKRALHEWKLVYVAQFIIEVIEFGDKLPFIHIPASKDSRNNK